MSSKVVLQDVRSLWMYIAMKKQSLTKEEVEEPCLMYKIERIVKSIFDI